MPVGQRAALNIADRIQIDVERTLCSKLWVKLPKTSSGCITRVNKSFLTRCQRFFVIGFKTSFWHEHFAANFQHVRVAIAKQTQRNTFNSTNVVRDVLARCSVSARCTTNQASILIQEADSRAIKFWLGRIADQIAGVLNLQTSTHTPVEVQQLIFRKCVFQGQHRHFVLNGAKRCNWLGAHTLGW